MVIHAESQKVLPRPRHRPVRVDLPLWLVANGRLSIAELADLRGQARAADQPVEDLLITSGRFSEADLLSLTAEEAGFGFHAGGAHADAAVLGELGKPLSRKLGFVAAKTFGGMPILLVSKPWNLTQIRRALPAAFACAPLGLIDTASLEDLIARQPSLGELTEAESCRGWDLARLRRRAMIAVTALALSAVLMPGVALLTALGLAMFSMIAVAGLKVAAAIATLTKPAGQTFSTRRAALASDPLVSVLVPLYRETDIAGRLVRRLSRIDRAAELMEVLIVVEADDLGTIAALRRADLPRHFRLVEVPAGAVRTKPNAMNYAVGFARGDIIGIYDAEDEPDPHQISAVVQAFLRAPPDVACVQGQLDFYNDRATWITRCFAADYAAWFRMVLPGIARLGLVVPLGGTTLFFRRDALERLGGWDAWNVTEDADLGLRLARHGWRCEVIETVTREEAVARPRAWIRQRSRWLKGYAMTWATHMRDPVQLVRDLGPVRFAAVQVQFLLTLAQYLLAPLLWSMWLMSFTDLHPLSHLLAPGIKSAVFWTCILVYLADAGVMFAGLRRAGKARLWPIIPLMQVYFLMGTVAAVLGLIEMLVRPYHWQKTDHGQD